jgi:hypothetical protein
MLMRKAGALPLAALLVLAGMPVSATLAKPPGLPLKQKDACLEKAPQQEVHSEAIVENTPRGSTKEPGEKGVKPPATMVFALSVDSVAGILSGMAAGQLPASSRASAIEEWSDWTPLLELFCDKAAAQSDSVSQASPAQDLGGWNVLLNLLGHNSCSFGIEITAALPLRAQPRFEPGKESPKQTKDHEQNAVDLSICPYLRSKEIRAETKVTMTASVLANLGKIQTARELYDQAEREFSAGHFDAACLKYQEVQKLCPGSRFDEQAGARLAEVKGAKDSESWTANEEEEINQPCNWWPKGVPMNCKIHLPGLNVIANLNQDGHGSVSLAFSLVVGAAFDLFDDLSRMLPR